MPAKIVQARSLRASFFGSRVSATHSASRSVLSSSSCSATTSRRFGIRAEPRPPLPARARPLLLDPPPRLLNRLDRRRELAAQLLIGGQPCGGGHQAEARGGPAPCGRAVCDRSG